MVKLKITLLTLITFFISTAIAQENPIFDELDSMTETERQEVIATFKSTRVILAPSIERVRKKQLHFRVSHLFSKVTTGYINLFGLDQLVNMNLSLDYGLANRIQLGLGRSNKSDKTMMPNIKVSVIRQSKGKRSFPLSISYFGNIDWKTNRYFINDRNKDFIGRLDYVNMLLIGRKFNTKLSLQLTPSWAHRNLTEAPIEPNDIYSLGFSGRYMLNDHISFNWEYFYTSPTSDHIKFENNPLSLGFDIETGGHVFQLYFSNALALHPGKFLINQNESFFAGNIHFGFSILREFNL
jgi:hypothetical protein